MTCVHEICSHGSSLIPNANFHQINVLTVLYRFYIRKFFFLDVLLFFVSFSVLTAKVSVGQSSSASSRADQYYGTFIGKFSLREHQVRGDVWAVNTTSLLLRDFIYDGQGKDAYFFIGTGDSPSSSGTLLPDNHGTTNRLQKYQFEDIILHMPAGKSVSDYAWLSVWDVEKAVSFGDVIIPKGFASPKAQPLGPLRPTDSDTLDSKRVRARQVTVTNSKTIIIDKFFFSGHINAVILVGVGTRPNGMGLRVPLPDGFVRLRPADGTQQLRLRLPSATSIFGVDWLSVWSVDNNRSMAHVSIPPRLNVPPDLSLLIKLPGSRLPNCEMLHPILQVRWEIFANYLTVELSGVIERNEYMAFGLSGDKKHSRMLGGDVALVWFDGIYAKAKDYYLGHKTFCSADARGGVCADDVLPGGVDDVQAIQGSSHDGITTITYRRPLNTSSAGNNNYDAVVVANESMPIIWSIGKLNEHDRPTMHFLYTVSDQRFVFGRVPVRNCDIFDAGARPPVYPRWPPVRLSATHSNVFVAHLGPAGGMRGYTAATRLPTWGTVWYINGTLAPELYVVRGQTYRFLIFGGRNAADFEHFHPLYITSNERGGIGQLPSAAVEQRNERIFAGARRNAYNVLLPTAYGGLCRWQMRDALASKMNITFLLADQYDTFAAFRARLILTCERHAADKAGVLEWTPTPRTPDVVYYQSFSHPNMGWRIQVLDSRDEIFKRIGTSSNSDDGEVIASASSQLQEDDAAPSWASKISSLTTSGSSRPILSEKFWFILSALTVIILAHAVHNANGL